MAEVIASYTPNGEWLYVVTNRDVYGAMLAIEPVEDDLTPGTPTDESAVYISENVVDLDQGQGWAPLSSAIGHFSIIAPEHDILNDWSLELWGLPRIYDKLNRDALTHFFGTAVPKLLDEIYEDVRPRRESIGDLRALQASREPVNTEERDAIDSQNKSLRGTTDEDINSVTQQARYELLASARYDSGRFVVARSVLINS